MRARMSGWADHAEDGSRYVARFNEEAALEEARSILADVERMPAPEDGGSAVYLPHAIYCDIARARDAACFVDERTILAESLRSFVEGN